MKKYFLISSKIHYGLVLLAELAIFFKSKKIVPLRDISKKSLISRKYLEQIALPLEKSGIIVGQRGKGGGYLLKKSPQKISLLEIFEVLGEKPVFVRCLQKNKKSCYLNPHFYHLCASRLILAKLQEVITENLKGKNLADFLLPAYEK